MGFWEDFAEQSLNGLGLGNGADAAKTLGKVAGDTIKAEAGQPKQQPQVVQANPISPYKGLDQLTKAKIAGVALPVLIVGAIGLYLVLRK